MDSSLPPINNSLAPMAIHYDGTTLSSDGEQSTPVDFTGFMSLYPDITSPPASFTFSGITASGPTIDFGTSILQQFSGGTLSLYNSAHAAVALGQSSGSALNSPTHSGRWRPVHYIVQHRDRRHVGPKYRRSHVCLSDAPFEYQRWQWILRRESSSVYCQREGEHGRRTSPFGSGAGDDRALGGFLRADDCLIARRKPR